MAVIIDEQWLEEHGIEAEGKEAEVLIDMVMDELEMRSGMAIADKLTDQQIHEFEKIENEDERVEWLDKVLPEYPEIVESKIAEMEKDLAKSKDQVALITTWSKM